MRNYIVGLVCITLFTACAKLVQLPVNTLVTEQGMIEVPNVLNIDKVFISSKFSEINLNQIYIDRVEVSLDEYYKTVDFSFWSQDEQNKATTIWADLIKDSLKSELNKAGFSLLEKPQPGSYTISVNVFGLGFGGGAHTSLKSSKKYSSRNGLYLDQPAEQVYLEYFLTSPEEALFYAINLETPSYSYIDGKSRNGYEQKNKRYVEKWMEAFVAALKSTE
ncbi:hypothetical protein [Aurantivibrio infirmus]